MIAYFDTSALVPLLVEEEGSQRAILVWDGADRVVSARLVYAEGRAALGAARRNDRVTSAAHRRAVAGLSLLYDQIDVVEISDSVVRRAGELAETHSLRGYDAVHLAAAETLTEEGVVLVAGHGPLVRAAAPIGLAVART